MDKFEAIDKVRIYEDRTPGYVELYNPWVGNHSQKNREQMIATIATISYGNKESKYPDKLYKKLQELKHSSCFEFLHTAQTSKYDISNSFRHQDFKPYNELGLYGGNLTEVDNIFKENAACFKMKIPIYIARQLVRHRSFSFLEMSRRYVKDSKVTFEFITSLDPDKNSFNELAVEEYARRIDNGEKPETARGCIGTDAYTEMFLFGDAKGLKNFFALRQDAHAQADIRELSSAMLKLLEQQQPELYKSSYET